jgi:hypothetical protein
MPTIPMRSIPAIIQSIAATCILLSIQSRRFSALLWSHTRMGASKSSVPYQTQMKHQLLSTFTAGAGKT